jgi:hypothetical protein
MLPNSSIKLTFNFKGKSSYSNWIMKLIATITLVYLVILTVGFLRKAGEIIGLKLDYVKHYTNIEMYNKKEIGSAMYLNKNNGLYIPFGIILNIPKCTEVDQTLTNQTIWYINK